MFDFLSTFFKSLHGISGVWFVLLVIMIFYFLLVIILNVICSFRGAKVRKGSNFLEKFLSVNYELLPYLNEQEKELMRETLSNTLKNQKVGELSNEMMGNSCSNKVKKNKSVKISEINNSYHYINVKSEII